MKRMMLVLIIVLASASIAAAQSGAAPATDVLGAHLNYGRGCPACHAPHSGASGNGANRSGTSTGNVALWGQDVGALYGKTLTFGQSEHGSYSETLPSSFPSSGQTPDVAGLLTCLSCHDGNYAQGAMMKNQIYETLPSSYGTFNTIPTLLGNDGTGAGNYLNDHPAGLNAIIPCGRANYGWDCTISATGAIQPGPLMSQFIANYGFFVRPGVYNNQPVVVCTTCHNQHLMNVVPVTNGGNGLTQAPATTGATGTPVGTGLPSGNYTTMFFIRAPYNPGTTTAGSNQNAQFCRQCHGAESNEMNGGTAGTTF